MAKFKYRKAKPAQPMDKANVYVLGMLYVVDVRMLNRETGEKTKHRVLMVGCEESDIERKLRWVFDSSSAHEFSITGLEKVREKIHILSTVITQQDMTPHRVIDRGEHQQKIPDGLPEKTSESQWRLFAVGLSTTINAADELHAIRQAGKALINSTKPTSAAGASLSHDSTLVVEEVPRSSGYATPRDVSKEINRAHIVRG